MLKYVYKFIVLVTVFLVSLLFMGKNMKEVKVDIDTTVEMKASSFPVVYLETGGYVMNLLHGYSGNMEANLIRESVVPLDNKKTLSVRIQENESTVKKIKYEVREADDNKLLDSGSISALNVYEKGKSANIKIQAQLETGKEYAVKITAVTNVSKKIHYYTRIKYYEDDYFLDEKMDFITNFHKSSLDKKKAETLIRYLEPNNSEENKSFAKVSIHSNFDLISWGNLKPKVITEITPTIKEFNIETASIQLNYFASIKTDSGTELYQVKEYYRVRYTLDRIYLLKFDRTMEALFDIGLTSVKKSELKLGISKDTDLDIVTSSDGNKICFERERALWYYNLETNSAVKVFSFLEEKADYIRDAYDQHDIRILNMDEEGNVDFIVYGYMNRGDYEGRVAIVLYKFYAAEARIKEQVYIPLETTYQILKENLNEFSYVNHKGNFYFTLNNVIYSYNIIARRLETVVENISNENLLMLKESKSIAWTNSSEPKKAKNITVLDLESEEMKIISASKGNNIRILGNIDSNIVYGYVKSADIIETTDGTLIVPVYKLEIADNAGNILKTYKKKKIYITDIEVKDNIIKLNRVKKTTNGTGAYYEVAEEDSILNKVSDETKSIGITTRITDLTWTELYISLPNGFIMKEKPKVETTSNTIITENTTLQIDMKKGVTEQYYVDAEGEITAVYDNPAEAISLADNLMGVVLNHKGQLVWERGNRYNNKAIVGISLMNTGNGVNSVGACLSMLLKHNQITTDAGELSSSKKAIYSILKDNLEEPINLTGTTLDQILYFVSGSRPVIAMKNQNDAVLITAYDQYYVTFMDPSTGKITKSLLTSATKMFESAGNVFISYKN